MKEELTPEDLEHMTPEDIKWLEFMNELDEFEADVKDTKTFGVYIQKLAQGYRDGILPEQPVNAYLHGMFSAARHYNSLVEQNKKPPVGPVDWKWLMYVTSNAFEF